MYIPALWNIVPIELSRSEMILTREALYMTIGRTSTPESLTKRMFEGTIDPSDHPFTMSTCRSCSSDDGHRPPRKYYSNRSDEESEYDEYSDELTSIESPEDRETHHEYDHISTDDTDEGTPRIGIEDHTHEPEEYTSDNKMPSMIESSEVGKYPGEDDQKCSHRIGTIQKSLESSHIGTIDTMKYRGSSAKIPC